MLCGAGHAGGAILAGAAMPGIGGGAGADGAHVGLAGGAGGAAGCGQRRGGASELALPADSAGWPRRGHVLHARCRVPTPPRSCKLHSGLPTVQSTCRGGSWTMPWQCGVAIQPAGPHPSPLHPTSALPCTCGTSGPASLCSLCRRSRRRWDPWSTGCSPVRCRGCTCQSRLGPG